MSVRMLSLPICLAALLKPAALPLSLLKLRQTQYGDGSLARETLKRYLTWGYRLAPIRWQFRLLYHPVESTLCHPEC